MASDKSSPEYRAKAAKKKSRRAAKKIQRKIVQYGRETSLRLKGRARKSNRLAASIVNQVQGDLPERYALCGKFHTPF